MVPHCELSDLSILVRKVETASGTATGWYDVTGKWPLINLCKDGVVVVSGYDMGEHLFSPVGQGTSLIIDMQGMFYPAYAVTKDGDLSPAESFLLSLAKLILKYQPRSLCIAAEGTAKRCVRSELFPEYKSGRGAKTSDFKFCLASLKQMLNVSGLGFVSVDGYEADDVMASVALSHRAGFEKVVVASRDKDMRQLMASGITIASTTKENEEVSESDLPVRADKIVEFMSLTGDSIDNIPGVPGIGPGTAKLLLERHGTLHHVIESAADDRIGKLISEHKDNILMSRKLVSLFCNLDVSVTGSVIDLSVLSGYGIKDWVIKKLQSAIDASELGGSVEVD